MRSRGLELALGSNKNEILSFDLAYTFLDARFTKYIMSRQMTVDPDGWGPLTASYDRVDLSGNRVPRTSRHNINLTLNYKASQKLTISPELIVKSSYYADEINLNKQEGYEIVNLRVTYNASKNLELFAKSDNLFDKDYYQFVNISSSALATMENDATIRVAPPRAFYAGLRYRF